MQQEIKQRILTRYPEWHYQPLRLTLQQIDNPTEVIREFFNGYNLPQARDLLKKWLDDSMIPDEQHYQNHIPIYNEVEKLMEAAWLFLQNGKENNPSRISRYFADSDIFKTKGDNSLSAVIDLLVRAIQPERIFLLHSGTDLIDLLIVIPDTS